MAEVVSRGFDRFPWSDGATQLRHRIAFLRHLEGGNWPDLSDAALLDRVDEWLRPRLAGARRLDDVSRLDLHGALLALLDWNQQRRLEQQAPTHIAVPSGSRVWIDYAVHDSPTMAVRIQELFGLDVTPSVGGGRIPLSLSLLSPSRRPVQITRDLPGFWRHSYFEVRKSMRGRYPRHPWPDDPLAAPPTTRAKPR
jgi:ATP-dependent helicase HrpB